MDNNLDSSIANLSEEDFNSWFEDTPKGTPSADDLVGGKDKPEIKQVKEDEVIQVKSPLDGIEEINIEDFEEKKIEDKDKKESEKTDEKIEDKEEVTEEAQAINEVLKSTTDYLVKKGLWLDWKDRDTQEITPEVYAEIAAKQDEVRLNNMFNELIDTTGDYGKAIINFVKEGGNPDDIIDIFKEQKQVESIDTKSEEGKKILINKYYKEVHNWKPEKIERQIATLIGSEGLETEADEIKELYNEFHKKELQKVTAEQAEYQETLRKRESEFKDTITKTIVARQDLNEKEKKFIQKSVLDYNVKLPNGNQVNEFYVKFAEVQANPEEYVDLVRFIMDKKNYLEKLSSKTTNKAIDEAYSFIKGNTALSTKKGSQHDKIERKNTDVVEFNFGFK